MAQTVLPLASPIAVNVVIFIAFVAMVTTGIFQGLKHVREFKEGFGERSDKAKIAAATILENVTLSDWTASNKSVKEALERLRNEISEHRHEVAENRHALVRLHDEIEEFRRDLSHKAG